MAESNGSKYVTYKWVLKALVGSVVGTLLTVVLIGAGFANAYFYPKSDGNVLKNEQAHIIEDVREIKEDGKVTQADVKDILKILRPLAVLGV